MNVCITGGNGYVGRKLAARFLGNEDSKVHLLIRADTEFKEKTRVLCHEFCDFAGTLKVSPLDLNHPEFSDPDSIDVFIHSAAVTRFNVEHDLAQRVNVEGSRNIFQFARNFKNLKRFIYVSTIYSSGLKAGRINEEVLNQESGFANEYERSKWQAEQILLQDFPDLPFQICRVATILAEDETGRVEQQNAFHNTLKLIYYGFLSLVPGKTDTPVYLVTADFVASAIASLSATKSSDQIFHVCHERGESLSLGEIIDIVHQTFLEDPEFKRKRLLKPMFVDQDSFQELSRAVSSMDQGVVGQALSSISPFGKQLFITKDVSNVNLRNAFPEYRAPEPRTLIRATTEHLIKTKWGRNKE